MTGFVFVTFDAASGLVRQPDRATAVMVGTDAAATVEQRLEASGLDVLTADDLRRSGLDLATRVFGTPIRLMVAIAFAAGVLIIALTVVGAFSFTKLGVDRFPKVDVIHQADGGGWEFQWIVADSTPSPAGWRGH